MTLVLPVNFIRIPLFKLHHIENMSDFRGFTETEWAQAEEEYSSEELAGIIEAIKWAVQNKDFDFASLLPGIDFQNNEIYSYFCKLKNTLPK